MPVLQRSDIFSIMGLVSGLCFSHTGAGAVRGGLSFNSAKYPFVYRDETIRDTLFGVEVPDPYRWLENGNSSATKACEVLYHLASAITQPFASANTPVPLSNANCCSKTAKSSSRCWPWSGARTLQDSLAYN